MEETDKKQVEQMIEDALKKAMDFATRKRGDTPTDNTQLTPKVYVDGQISSVVSSIQSQIASIVAAYPGYVEDDGSAGTPFPSGWTSARITDGEYKITHNLGTTSYAMTVTPVATHSVPAFTTHNSNDITVVFEQKTTADPANNDFHFVLALQ